MNLKEIIEEFPKKRIVVVGDVMLDKYIYGEVDRISPEAPVPIVKVEKEVYELGGAANVAANVVSLGGKAFLFGYIGSDYSGKILSNEINKKGIKYNLPEVLSQTTRKTRVISNNHQVTRIDREDHANVMKEFENKFAECILKSNPDVIIISDYAKGTITNNLISRIKNKGIKILVDPKPKNNVNYSGVYLITPNLKEAIEMSGLKNVSEAGKSLQKSYLSNILITRGKEGMTLFEGKEEVNFPTQAKEVYDVSGAGDSVVATLALGISSRIDLKDSVFLANTVAGIAVSKAGTATVSKSELEQVIEKEYTKLKSLEELKEIRVDLKRKGKKVVFTSGCYDILHPGHIELLKIAKSYGDVLVLAINGDKSSFFKTKGDDRPILNEDERVRVLSGLESIDYITTFDEDTPLRIIRELKPDVKIKGGTYIKERVSEEDKFIKSYGGVAEYIGMIGDFSTTKLINKIRDNGDSDKG